jgi:hypothetical protein
MKTAATSMQTNQPERTNAHSKALEILEHGAILLVTNDHLSAHRAIDEAELLADVINLRCGRITLAQVCL